MELTNKERKYLPLNLVKKSWKKVQLNEECCVYIDGNILVKRIITKGNYYYESDVEWQLDETNSFLLPKTSRGKPRKLIPSNVNDLPNKTYIHWLEYVSIGNGVSETAYYNSMTDGKQIKTIQDFKKWLTKWIEDTRKEDLIEMEQFKQAKRRHCLYQEGDYFRFKLDRRKYGYGRILMDITKYRKSGAKFWDIVAFKPVIIEIFHIATEDKNVTIETLKKLKTLPSQYIMDNVFYYGEFEKIGHDVLPDKIAYPIIYGRSIDVGNFNVIKFQCGTVYEEIEYKEGLLIEPYQQKQSLFHNFINCGIGYGIDADLPIIQECIKQNSNLPYWKQYKGRENNDLRSPKNLDKLKEVLKQVNHIELLEIYENQNREDRNNEGV